MTVRQLLLPLRVPELGPHLGKLVVGTGRTPGGLSLEPFRYRLVSRVLMAAGDARRLAARGERDAAVTALGRTAWLEAWEEAAAGISHALIEQVNAHLAAEATAVRMPARLRRRIQLDKTDERAITARLGSAGADLVPVLDDLESRAIAATQATPAERHVVEGWQAMLQKAARRLEASWLMLEESVESETAHWRRVADDIAEWRKPLWPVLLAGVTTLPVAVWLGLMLGGFIEAPGWISRLWQVLP